MITMKGFFLLTIINVFVWNSIEDAGPYQLQIAEIMNEFYMGEDVKMLMISNLFLNIEHNENNSILMLAKKYHKFGLRVLTFEPRCLLKVIYRYLIYGRVYKLMNKNKIEIIPGNKLRNLWESINNMELKEDEINNISFREDYAAAQSLYKRIPEYDDFKCVYHTFLVDMYGSVIEPYSEKEINEREFIDCFEPWKYITSMYELEVNGYNGDLVSMENYRNKELIISFILEGSTKIIEKLQSLQQLANNFNSKDFKILVFLGDWLAQKLKDHIMPIINNDTEAKMRIFINNNEAYILNKFVKSNKQDVFNISGKPFPYTVDFLIGNKGNVIMGFEDNSPMKVIENILKKYVTMKEHVVNTD